MIFIKIKNQHAKIKRYYKKAFPIIWILSLIPILIINSSLLQVIYSENISYFQEIWIWFLILGIVFIIIGIRIASMAMKIYKVNVINFKESKLIKTGIYSVIRHPIYLSWVLIFMGCSFAFDSFLAILFIPILIVLLEIHCILEEKYILLPNFGEEYREYKKKIPFRIFSPPYNYLLIIISFVVIYIGLLNFVLGN
ncbi:MAG: methyltransferase family protein [Candidatus Hodarchaeota archaeon]